MALPAFAARAADDTAQRLEELRGRLATLQQDLNQTRGKRDAQREGVQLLERRIGTLVAEQRRTDGQLRGLKRRLQRMEREAATERTRLREHERLLSAELRAAYVLGRQEGLRLLLSVEEPERIARLLVYHNYVQRARAVQVNRLEHSLSGLEKLRNDIERESAALTALRTTQAERKRELELARRERATTLAALNREVKDRAREVERLQQDRARLERLLTEIRPMLQVLPPPPPAAASERFSRLAGRLPLPVRGRIVARFNETKALGNLRWRGIFIGARDGEEIHSVARGRVVYSDWLRGFGLLLILDHGDGYMTLYGHNQSVYRQTGDWVEAGEPIGLVGNTGDAPRPGLYFEIRHHGEPHDPLRWCVARSP